jgi:hypothetical protein
MFVHLILSGDEVINKAFVFQQETYANFSSSQSNQMSMDDPWLQFSQDVGAQEVVLFGVLF